MRHAARYDDALAMLDASDDEGPHLRTGDFQAICGTGMSPGMVAAMAQSMVRVE